MKRNASNNRDVKTLNRILVRNIIRKQGPIARFELAKETGLTPPTISMIVNEFIEDGIVLEVGYGKSSGGRRPIMLELNPQAAYIFAIKLQRDEASVAIFNIGGNRLIQRSLSIDTSRADNVVEALGSCFDDLVMTIEVDKEKVLYCGVSTPGLVNVRRGLIRHSSNLQWNHVPLGAMLAKRLGGMPVYVENISNAAAFAEREYGCGLGYSDLVYLNLSVGIGAGIIVGGELYGGASGYAGEIGHIPMITEGGPLCSCGRTGCLESICGTAAVIRRIKDKLTETDLVKFGWNKSRIGINDFFQPGFLELAEVKAVFAETGKWIGITVGNLVSIFNPKVIVLGGELPQLDQNLIKTVNTEMSNRVLEELIGTAKIVSSNMQEDPALMGAYALALDMLFSTRKW